MSGVEGKLKISSSEKKVFLWVLDKDPHMTENTNGTTGGLVTFEPLKVQNTVEVDIYLDTGDTLESIGLTPGSQCTISLRIGTSTNGYMSWVCKAGKGQETGCDANGLARAHVTIHGHAALPSPSTYS